MNDSNKLISRESEAEMALLALCMRKDEAILKTVENKISTEDFTDPRNRTIFSVVMDMFFNNVHIDRITVYSELERRKLADQAGGQRYVYKVGDTTAVQSALVSYVSIIREQSTSRKLMMVIDDVKSNLSKGNLHAGEAASYAVSKITPFINPEDSRGFEPLHDILKTTMTDITAEIRDNNAGGKIKLGYPKLDSMLGGLRPGSLNILAARPSMGKSALAINMAANVAANGHTVAIFSLEMSKQEIGSRLMSSCMNKPVNEIIYSHKMTDDDRKQIDTALIKLGDYPIYIDDNSDTNPISMKSKLQQLASSGAEPKLVIVDYLQLMTMKSARARSRNEEVTDISRNLKLLAKDLNIPIIALSQLSRGAAQREDHTPQLSDLRDSGAIEQDADTVMFIDRPDYYKKKEEGSAEEGNTLNGDEVRPAYIYLEKNRHGKTGRDSVWWIPSKTMFYEHSDRDPSEPESQHMTSATTDYDDQYDVPPQPDDKDIPPEDGDIFPQMTE
ncbi:replicative DNA helicase [Ruminococcaceae bacterium R-25]|nr:replicative DNA helicase [Ruminococcaceae bacterium R-25]SUQ21704.1 replicative DNA helicase [Oscillospiraceae bacterium]